MKRSDGNESSSLLALLLLLLALPMLLLATACSPERDAAPPGDGAGEQPGHVEQPDTGPRPGQPPAAPAPATDRPESYTGTLSLEGMEERFTFRLVRSPADFPVPFSTYATEDLLVETGVREAGHWVRFVANFGGVRNDQAYLEIFFHPRGTREAAALAAAAALIPQEARRERAPGIPDRYGWSRSEFDFARQAPTGEWFIGHVAVGLHSDVYFRVVVHHPEEYAEGFGPRISRTLEDWRWEDTGEPLLER